MPIIGLLKQDVTSAAEPSSSGLFFFFRRLDFPPPAGSALSLSSFDSYNQNTSSLKSTNSFIDMSYKIISKCVFIPQVAWKLASLSKQRHLHWALHNCPTPQLEHSSLSSGRWQDHLKSYGDIGNVNGQYMLIYCEYNT